MTQVTDLFSSDIMPIVVVFLIKTIMECNVMIPCDNTIYTMRELGVDESHVKMKVYILTLCGSWYNHSIVFLNS